LLLLVGLLILVIDQGTKYLAVSRLTGALEDKSGRARVSAFYRPASAQSGEQLLDEGLRKDCYTVVENYWHFRYVENPGAAWGLWANLPERFRQPFFLGVSVLALGFISFMYSRLHESQRFLRTALSLVLGGAVGNFLDRLIRGYVIDFIDWHWRDTPGLRWPTFNMADVAISVGVALILTESLRTRSVGGGNGALGGVGLAPGASSRGA